MKTFCLTIMLLLSAAMFAQPADYDVYLLIGQSNMAGRGTLIEEDLNESFEGIYLLGEDDKPVEATHPFNQYSTIRKKNYTQGMNPGCSFAKQMYAYNHRPVLIVCNARGGTSITQWEKGSEYYSEAVRRTREALKYGTLKGILWHQGSADVKRVDSYMDMLSAMVSDLRTDLYAPQVPFIAGEIGTWMENNERKKDFNRMIRTIRHNIPYSDWVTVSGIEPHYKETEGLTSKDPHFSRAGQLELGKRYAKKLIKHYK